MISIRAFMLLLLTLAAQLIHAEPVSYSFSDALASKQAKEVLDPNVPLFFGGQSLPALAEKNRPDIYTRSEGHSWPANSALGVAPSSSR
ncbi:MAG TPA: hypothetical protein VLC92_07880 [Rhodocyclaceae bacterium]|nr:hypothetical protein [Rhodocyclaceae bacterium]